MKYSSLSTSAAVLKKRYKYLQLFTLIHDIRPIDTSLIELNNWEDLYANLKLVFDKLIDVGGIRERSKRSMGIPRRANRMQAVRKRVQRVHFKQEH